MPGIPRSSPASSVASSCGWLATTSAPLRYARILKGFSVLISRRSAISERIRAMATLSKSEPFHLQVVVEDLCMVCGEGTCDPLSRLGRAVAEEAPSATGTADLCRGSTRRPGPVDQRVYGRCGDPRREP